MTGKFTLTSRSEPDCKSFLEIRWPDEEYHPIDEFIQLHPGPSLNELRLCAIRYRDQEKNYDDYLNEYVAFTNRLSFLEIELFRFLVEPTITASHYFVDKARDCLQNARFFAIQSNLILDYKDPALWKRGYLSQYHKRCVYFGTATTWYSNTFDQLLQAVYWGFQLFTSAKDRKSNVYDDSWDVKKIMKFCTYEFVLAELKLRNLTDVRSALINCYGKIEEVRTWANYIKHKGGIEYKYLEPESPIQIFIMKPDPHCPGKVVPDDRFDLSKFKSPIEVDIDEKITVIETAHIALHECATKIIEAIDFDKYQLSFGGQAV